MNKFALMVLALAFGGLMVAGCPKDEPAPAPTDTTKDDATKDDATKDDATKDDATKDDATKDDAAE